MLIREVASLSLGSTKPCQVLITKKECFRTPFLYNPIANSGKDSLLSLINQRLNAVKEDKIVYLDNSYFGMSANLKVIEGLGILQDIIYQ